MKIFLSYSSRQQTLAEEICLELEHSGHSVFFDKKSLRAGSDFRKKIRKELDQCEVFVFLISPTSVAPKSYARSELEIAREKWPQPEGHILPVMAIATDLESIPSYLKAVTILNPEGEIVEAVSRSLDDWSPMEEVDVVEQARKIAKERGIPPAVAEFAASAIAIGVFKMDVIERGLPNKIYKRKIRGIIGRQGQIIQELTECTASAGREYVDDRGRTCREVTVSFCCDGEWISNSSVFYLHRGKWVDDRLG